MVKICEVVDGCEDCPKYGDDCDGRGDAEMLNEDFRPKYMQQSRHDDGKDLISRADAIDACCRGWNNTIEDCIRNIKEIPSAWYKGMECAQDIISALPSAEAVEVVRCEDCKHHEKFLFDDSKLLCWVHDIGIVVSPTDYCSLAERREDGEACFY